MLIHGWLDEPNLQEFIDGVFFQGQQAEGCLERRGFTFSWFLELQDYLAFGVGWRECCGGPFGEETLQVGQAQG